MEKEMRDRGGQRPVVIKIDGRVRKDRDRKNKCSRAPLCFKS